jgi:hypothetical protein
LFPPSRFPLVDGDGILRAALGRLPAGFLGLVGNDGHLDPGEDRGPDLPAGYGDDRIVVLVRDPRNLFVCWELAGGAFERVAGIEKRLGIYELKKFTPRE